MAFASNQNAAGIFLFLLHRQTGTHRLERLAWKNDEPTTTKEIDATFGSIQSI